MDIDYSQGQYEVFDANDSLIGRIDGDEFVRRGDHLIYRIDGLEVYEVNGGLLAVIEGGIAMRSDGRTLFTIRPT